MYVGIDGNERINGIEIRRIIDLAMLGAEAEGSESDYRKLVNVAYFLSHGNSILIQEGKKWKE